MSKITVQGVYKHDAVMTYPLMKWMAKQVTTIVTKDLGLRLQDVHWIADIGTWAKLLPAWIVVTHFGRAGHLTFYAPVSVDVSKVDRRGKRTAAMFPHSSKAGLDGSHYRFKHRTGRNGYEFIRLCLTKYGADYVHVCDPEEQDTGAGWADVRKAISQEADIIIHFYDSGDNQTHAKFGDNMYAEEDSWQHRFQIDIADFEK